MQLEVNWLLQAVHEQQLGQHQPNGVQELYQLQVFPH